MGRLAMPNPKPDYISPYLLLPLRSEAEAKVAAEKRRRLWQKKAA